MRKVIVFEGYPDFKPNISPYEMFKLGIMGGTYWRPIYSRVVNKNIKNDHKKYKWDIPEDMLSSPIQDPLKNHFKVKSGMPLEYWEDNGWIHESDPRGWISWYTNFYNGRRIPDVDRMQIDRWISYMRRWRNKKKMSSVVKQALLHWGWLVD
jgi:hypothetical protein